MNLKKIPIRLDLLNTALYNDSKQKDKGRDGYFTVGERISINQERGYLLSMRSNEIPLREYKVPEWIEEKIKKSIE